MALLGLDSGTLIPQLAMLQEVRPCWRCVSWDGALRFHNPTPLPAICVQFVFMVVDVVSQLPALASVPNDCSHAEGVAQ